MNYVKSGRILKVSNETIGRVWIEGERNGPFVTHLVGGMLLSILVVGKQAYLYAPLHHPTEAFGVVEFQTNETRLVIGFEVFIRHEGFRQ